MRMRWFVGLFEGVDSSGVGSGGVGKTVKYLLVDRLATLV